MKELLEICQCARNGLMTFVQFVFSVQFNVSVKITAGFLGCQTPMQKKTKLNINIIIHKRSDYSKGAIFSQQIAAHRLPTKIH